MSTDTQWRASWSSPRSCERLASILATLTAEPTAEWKRRTLVWPDDGLMDLDRRAAIHAGALVRWRIDEGKFHLDSSSSLVTTDAPAAWSMLRGADLVSGEMPAGIKHVRSVVRAAMLAGAA